MSSVMLYYMVFLWGGFSYTATKSSISDMVKLLTTATRMYEKTEYLATTYDSRLKRMSEALKELKYVQTDQRANILNPILLVKVSLSINRVLQTRTKYIKEIREDLLMLTNEKDKASSLSIDEHLRVVFELQDFYDFDTQQIADGILEQSIINITLSALDCYEIGSWALEHHDGYHAKLWLHEAKRRLIVRRFDETVRMVDILLKLANAYSVHKDAETTNQLIAEVLKTDPFNQGAQQLQVVMQSARTFYNVFVDRYSIFPTSYDWGANSNYTFIRQLCRGYTHIQEEASENFCYYQTVFGYYLIQVEVLSVDPPIGIVHGIITNEEISAFHQRAALQNKFRVALNHSTLIRAEPNKIIQQFKKKIELVTLPPVIISDLISYTHFDIGEFHKLRFHPVKVQKSFVSVRERGFHLMVFLNNAEGGGNVIFPWLNLSIASKKGSALLWEFPKGKSVKRLLHTVCPIYSGNLTVAHVRGYIYEKNNQQD